MRLNDRLRGDDGYLGTRDRPLPSAEIVWLADWRRAHGLPPVRRRAEGAFRNLPPRKAFRSRRSSLELWLVVLVVIGAYVLAGAALVV